MGKTAKEKAQAGFSIATPLIGLGTELFTGIRALRPAPKVTAGTPGYNYQAVPAAVAAQGHGMGRGPATLQAFRTAGQIGPQMADAQARANMAASAQNAAFEVNRRERAAQFGRDAADSAAALATGLVTNINAMKDQKQQATGTEQPKPFASAGSFISDEYNKTEGTEEQKGTPVPDNIGLDELAQNPFADQEAALSVLDSALQEMTAKAKKNKAEALQLQRSAYGMPYPETLADISPEIDQQARITNIALEEINNSGLSMSVALPGVLRKLGVNYMQMFNPEIRQFFNEEEEVG